MSCLIINYDNLTLLLTTSCFDGVFKMHDCKAQNGGGGVHQELYKQMNQDLHRQNNQVKYKQPAKMIMVRSKSAMIMWKIVTVPIF